MFKKITSLLVLMIFLTSLVSFSFAKNENIVVASESKSEGEDTQIVTAKSLKAAKVTKAVVAANIREHQMERLMLAVEKCKEQNITAEGCEAKLQKRIALIDKLNEKDLQRIEKIQAVRTEKIKKLADLRLQKSFMKFNKEGLKARVIAEKDLIRARLNYIKAKENYLNAKKNYINNKNKFLTVKEELKKCRGLETEECINKRVLIIAYSKEYLLHISDLILKELDKIKNKIESSEDLSEEEVNELLNTINEKIGKIEEAKGVIENLNNESTKEDIKDAAKLIKKAWLETRYVARRAAGQLINSRIGGIIVKSKQLEIKLNRILEKMIEQGKDISKVENLVEDFNSMLESARNNYEKAVEKYKEARLATENIGEIIQEAHGYMKQAHIDLKDAHKILRDIFQELKNQGVEQELISEENVAEEQVDEDLAEEETEEKGE